MRSHAKGSALRSIMRQAVISALAAIIGSMALTAASACASATHPFLETFGSSAQPSFGNPEGLALDQSSGDLLVIDANAGTVSRYNSDGTPADFSALGTNVIDGQGSGDGGAGGLSFGGANEVQVAVDHSSTATDGDIYVTQPGNHLVDTFSSTGAYLGHLTESSEGQLGEACGVAVGPDGSVYVGDYNGKIHKYAAASNPPLNTDNTANFGYSNPCNLAVGAGPTAGFLFAVSYGGELAKLDSSSGAVEYTVASEVQNVSVDPSSGHLYAVAGSEFRDFDASGAGSATLLSSSSLTSAGQGIAVDGATGNIYVARRNDPNIEVFGAAVTIPTVTIEAPSTVTGVGATLQGTVNPEGVTVSECKFEYGPVSGGAYPNSAPCEGSIPTDSADHNVSAAISGLKANGVEYHFRLAAKNANGTSTSASESFETKFAGETGNPTAVTQNTATLNGVVNPVGQAITDCKFEYGTDSTYGGSVPCSPDAASIPGDFQDHAVSADLLSLSEGTTYYFRLVTTSAGGVVIGKPQAFRTSSPPLVSAEEALPGQSFATLGAFVNPSGSPTTYHFEWGPSTAYGNRTPGEPDPSIGSGADQVAVSAQLSGLSVNTTYHFRVIAANPLGTTYSPDQEFTTYKALGLPDGRAYEQVSPVDKNGTDISTNMAVGATDGNRLVFSSRGSFAGAPTNQAVIGANAYMSERGPQGWKTKSISPRGGGFLLENNYQGFTPDLSLGAVRWNEDAVLGFNSPEAQPGLNLYLHDNLSGSFQLLNGPAGDVSPFGGFVWGTPDFSRMVIQSRAGLTPDSPCDGHGADGNNGACAYEWRDGSLHLASVLPGDIPATGVPGGGLEPAQNIDHAISNDGSRLFFTSAGKIYAREDGTSSSLIGPGSFEGAEAARGNRVIFKTAVPLVDTDTDSTNDLYIYDFTKPEGHRLTLISEDRDPAAPDGAVVEGSFLGDGGVAGVSEDLRRVYFVTHNQIVGGAPEGPGPKLYLWDDTGINPTVTFIGMLDSGDGNDWRGVSVEQRMKPSRPSSDGRFIAFLSTARLTPFDNEGADEIYRYDAEEHALECASCSPDAAPAQGYLAFDSSHFDAPINHLLTNTSDNGSVFFETARGLVPQDSNGKIDVYEYEGGRLRLISKGTGDADSRFLDATPSGSNVFFTTRDKLVGWDEDTNFDAYDARVGGGLPEPPTGPPVCEGDACQPAPVVPNDPTPASSSFQGAGNVSGPRQGRCGTGETRRGGKCRKKKRTHKKRSHHRKPATRHG